MLRFSLNSVCPSSHLATAPWAAKRRGETAVPGMFFYLFRLKLAYSSAMFSGITRVGVTRGDKKTENFFTHSLSEVMTFFSCRLLTTPTFPCPLKVYPVFFANSATKKNNF